MSHERQAIMITSFPPHRYRRPIFASRALKLLGLKSKLYLGWDMLNRATLFQKLVSISNNLRRPLNWLLKDMAYEASMLTQLDTREAACIINLNILGAASLKILKDTAPLVLDLQDVTIQDDGTLPLYDRTMLKLSDLTIFTSRAIKTLVEKNHPKTCKKTAYIPFGIDLQPFDIHYNRADPRTFIKTYSLENHRIITYTGAAYLWGNREGQGLSLLLKAFSKLVKQSEKVKLVIQGAASPNSDVGRWIQKEIRQNNLLQHVLLLPSTYPHDPLRMSMFKASDLLALPIGDILGTYYSEQQKIFEYMAASRPIAMVATPARLGILSHETAYIAHRPDTEEFASIMAKALEERDEAEPKAKKPEK